GKKGPGVSMTGLDKRFPVGFLAPRATRSSRLRRRAVIAALAAHASWGWAAMAAADDWPQWQGPDRNAISRERGLLQEWTKEGPPLAWKIKGLGGGHSTPSIAGGRIFGMSH